MKRMMTMVKHHRQLIFDVIETQEVVQTLYFNNGLIKDQKPHLLWFGINNIIII